MSFLYQIKRYKFILAGIILLPILVSLKSVSAQNITINGLNKVEFAQGTSRAISCDPDGIQLSLGTKYTSNGVKSGYYFSDFTISDISTNCLNKLFTIYFSDQDENTIPNIAAKQGSPEISEVSFILRPVQNPTNLNLYDTIQAKFPTSYVAVDYSPVATFNLNNNIKRVKVSLDYHHYVPASDVAYFAIEISESETVDRFETLVQQIPINCGNGTENVYFERIRDGVNRKIIKSQIVPIPIECNGKWIQLKVRDSNGTQVEINKGYSSVDEMDACNRQRFGSANEITFYLPTQTPFQPLLSGSTNSYSTAKVPLGDGRNAVYVDYLAEDIVNAWTGPAQINVLLANCETNPNNSYFYPGF
jgi:hypothetical protein